MTTKESQLVESATQLHLARPSFLTDLVPGFIPEIPITEQPGQDAVVQGPGAPGASWASGSHSGPSQAVRPSVVKKCLLVEFPCRIVALARQLVYKLITG